MGIKYKQHVVPAAVIVHSQSLGELLTESKTLHLTARRRTAIGATSGPFPCDGSIKAHELLHGRTRHCKLENHLSKLRKWMPVLPLR